MTEPLRAGMGAVQHAQELVLRGSPGARLPQNRVVKERVRVTSS